MQDNTDFENLENITFKSITDGLGFHHDADEAKEELVRAKRIKSNNETKKVHALQNFIKEDKTIIDMGELSPFYQNKIETVDAKSIEILKDKNQDKSLHVEEASMITRLAAWLIDISIIVVSFMMTLYMASTAANINLLNAIDVDLFINTSPLMLFYYIFYFSIMDKSKLSSIGKRLLRIKLEQTNLSLVKTTTRSLITILSLFTLGLGSYLLLQDKLTETKVVNA